MFKIDFSSLIEEKLVQEVGKLNKYYSFIDFPLFKKVRTKEAYY